MVQSAHHFYGDDDNNELELQILREAIKEIVEELAELPVSRVVTEQAKRLQKRIEEGRGAGPELAALLIELQNNLWVDLSSCWFLMLTSEVRDFYEQANPPFGEMVAKTFPELSNEIAAASRCYALDEWTACVFHLMRLLEQALRVLAARVGLEPDAMKHENWKNVIDQIEKKIREMGELRKSPEKIEAMRILSEVATQFRYFKDAWRNHVSHANVTYDRHSGLPIWQHVRGFMQQLATIDSESASADVVPTQAGTQSQ